MSNKSEPKKEPKYPEIGARLTQFIDMVELNQRQFALAVDSSAQVVSHLMGGHAMPSGGTLKAIADKWPGFNASWLLTGRGEPFPNGKMGDSDKGSVFTGGVRTQMGARIHQPGEIEDQLPIGWAQDMDNVPAGKPLPTDAKGYIKMVETENVGLRKELDIVRKELRALGGVVNEQREIINEQRESLKEQRENTAFLRRQLAAAGKTEGNQEYAPVQPTDSAPTRPIGFQPVVRQMWELTTVGESEEMAA